MSATASHRFPCQCLTTTGVFLPHLEHSQVQAELQIYNSPVFIQQYKPNLCQWLYHLKIMSNTPHIRQTYENETLDIWDVAKTFDFCLAHQLEAQGDIAPDLQKAHGRLSLNLVQNFTLMSLNICKKFVTDKQQK